MNSSINRITKSPNNWVLPVSVMAAIAGIMASKAWVTGETRMTRNSMISADQQARVENPSIEYADKLLVLQKEVTKLRNEKTKLENAVAEQDSSTKVLNDSLQESKTFAGLTAMMGPGIKVTLKDSMTKPLNPTGNPTEFNAYVIHDVDVLRFVNELWASGAEAISVNDYRISPRSYIRCVGPSIRVDDNHIASPFVIRAIGDRDTLMGSMMIPGGITEAYMPGMVQIEREKSMTLPSFSGTTAFKVAKVVKSK